MSDSSREDLSEQKEHDAGNDSALTRREFLRVAGAAGVAMGMTTGLGGFLVACNEENPTTTPTPASTTTITSSSTTTGAASTTAVSTEPEMGEEIAIGFITPITGTMKAFGQVDEYCAKRWREYCGDTLLCGDGKKHPVSIEVADSRSDPKRASQVAQDLITEKKADILMVASTAETVIPVVEQCEINGCPVVSTDCPWQIYLGENREYKWSYHVFFGIEDFVTMNWSCFEQIPCNKVVGAMYDNTSEGKTFSVEGPQFLRARGYRVVQPDSYQVFTEDFARQIAMFKKEGVELIMGNMLPPDFSNFWKQATQNELNPRAVLVSKAILLPQQVEALGDVANGLLTELPWHHTFPWRSSLTGETCVELANDFEATTGSQQSSLLLHYACGEMAIYAMRRATDPKSRMAVLAAIEMMNFDSILGRINFSATVAKPTGPGIAAYRPGPGRRTKNVYDPGLGGAQWLITGGKRKFDLVPVDNSSAPYMDHSTISVPRSLAVTG